ncbi:uncharacterized protein LOC734765 [Xenopus laevis]|uniref:MGC130918 protein n=1 Tax=Xenopus laevis TaxID=8355 RepID=Q3KQ67_XENLA|nr:Hemoglobin subunit alpha-3-like [Xenopus laevis]AAI06367.1 MGC130918 protein [Xenopus laevis]
MTLTESEKAAVIALFEKISSSYSSIGAEALERLFLSYPQTNTYFSHFDLSHGSSDLTTHGGKVMTALGKAAKKIDDLDAALSALSDLHAFNLRVDPGNFKLLSHTIQETLAIHYSSDFGASTQTAFDKFLTEITAVLTSKYR